MIKTLALAGAAAALVAGSMAVAQTTSQNPNAPNTGMNAQSTAPNTGMNNQNTSQNGYNAPSATDNGANASATAPNGRTGERG